MIAVSEKSFIVAIADNYKYVSFLFESREANVQRKKINALNSVWGLCFNIQIISRTLARS